MRDSHPPHPPTRSTSTVKTNRIFVAVYSGTRSLVGSPQANAYCERVIGTLRRDCLDHILVKDEVHAERVLKEYRGYYDGRPHRGLHTQAPLGARWLPPARPTPATRVLSRPILGGLHHEYAVVSEAA